RAVDAHAELTRLRRTDLHGVDDERVAVLGRTPEHGPSPVRDAEVARDGPGEERVIDLDREPDGARRAGRRWRQDQQDRSEPAAAAHGEALAGGAHDANRTERSHLAIPLRRA